MGAAAGQHYETDACAKQQQDTEADREIATTRACDGGLERTGAMFDDQTPCAGTVAVEYLERDAIGDRLRQSPMLGRGVLILVCHEPLRSHNYDLMAVRRRRHL